MIGLLEALERGLAGELVHGHVLEFVFAQDFLVAPRADRAVELQHLRRMLLVVPLVERGLPVLGDGGPHDEDGDCHIFHPPASSPRRRGPRTQCRMGEGSYKNESSAGARTVSDEIVQVAGSMDDAHDLHTVVDYSIEN